jgi:hypothetical protein
MRVPKAAEDCKTRVCCVANDPDMLRAQRDVRALFERDQAKRRGDALTVTPCTSHDGSAE